MLNSSYRENRKIFITVNARETGALVWRVGIVNNERIKSQFTCLQPR